MKTLFVGCLLLLVYVAPVDYIGKDRARWKPYYSTIAPAKTVDKWLLPFHVSNRSDYKQIRVISIFGDPRDSYLKGHIHTAIDVVPARSQGHISVYPMAKGVVCSIHLGENQKTVVLRHTLKDSTTIFTSYKHIKEVYVRTGQQVTENTVLARLFTATETKKFGGNYDHLHLEIRKSFDDYGCASWLTMSKAELAKRFYDPLAFIKARVK